MIQDRSVIPLRLFAGLLFLLLCRGESRIAAQPPSRETARRGASGAPQGTLPQLHYEKTVLGNGIEVVLVPRDELPVVHVNLSYRVGTRDEQPGLEGITQVIEGLMFQGSTNAPDPFLVSAGKAGVSLEHAGVSSSITEDRSVFAATVPAENLEYLLWLEADRLATLPSFVTEVSVKEQLDSPHPLSSRLLEHQGAPGPFNSRLPEQLDSYFFPPGHPYHRARLAFSAPLDSIPGSAFESGAASGSGSASGPGVAFSFGSGLRATPASGSGFGAASGSRFGDEREGGRLEQVRAFLQEYYRPNRLSIVIAGKLDKAQTLKWIRHYFGGIPRGPSAVRTKAWVPALSGSRTIELRGDSTERQLMVVWPSPEFLHEDEIRLDAAAELLARGISSTLNRSLIHDKALCSSVEAGNISRELSGIFSIKATLLPEASFDATEKAILAEIARAARMTPDPTALGRARARLLHRRLMGLEHLGGPGGLADTLNRYNLFAGDPGALREQLQQVEELSGPEVKGAIASWLEGRAHLTVRILSQVPAAGEGESDRVRAPGIRGASSFRIPEVHQSRLANGLDVMVLQRKGMPRVRVRLVARAGSAFDPKELPGLASMVVDTMPFGTERHRATYLQDALDGFGASLEGQAARDYAYLELDTIRAKLPGAFNILGEVAQSPYFPERELEKVKAVRLGMLRSESVFRHVKRVREGVFFGLEHPYGHAPKGRVETISTMTREQLQTFHSIWWRPMRAALIFVGDITPERANALAQQVFGHWLATPPVEPAGEGYAPSDGVRALGLDIPMATHTSINRFVPCSRGEASEDIALRLADMVLGGGSLSRLAGGSSRSHGASWKVEASELRLRQAGLCRATLDVPAERTREGLRKLVAESRALGSERPIDERELETARSILLADYARALESYSDTADLLAQLWSLGLPATQLQQNINAIRSTTLAEVNGAARRFIAPRHATYLLMGESRWIRSAVEQLQLGDLRFLSENGEAVGR